MKVEKSEHTKTAEEAAAYLRQLNRQDRINKVKTLSSATVTLIAGVVVLGLIARLAYWLLKFGYNLVDYVF